MGHDISHQINNHPHAEERQACTLPALETPPLHVTWGTLIRTHIFELFFPPEKYIPYIFFTETKRMTAASCDLSRLCTTSMFAYFSPFLVYRICNITTVYGNPRQPLLLASQPARQSVSQSTAEPLYQLYFFVIIYQQPPGQRPKWPSHQNAIRAQSRFQTTPVSRSNPQQRVTFNLYSLCLTYIMCITTHHHPRAKKNTHTPTRPVRYNPLWPISDNQKAIANSDRTAITKTGNLPNIWHTSKITLYRAPTHWCSMQILSNLFVQEKQQTTTTPHHTLTMPSSSSWSSATVTSPAATVLPYRTVPCLPSYLTCTVRYKLTLNTSILRGNRKAQK